MTKLPPASVRLAAAAFLARLLEARFGGSQTKAAQAMGVPQSQISALLTGSGRGLGLVTLLRIADFAGASLDEVIGRTPPGSAGTADADPESGPRGSDGGGSSGSHRIHDNFG